MTCGPSNFCSKGAGRKVWPRKPSANWQHPDSTGCHQKDHQIGWVPKPTLPTRHHKLSHIHCIPNGNIQTKQPSHKTASGHPCCNSQLHLPKHTSDKQLQTPCHRQTHSHCILLLLESQQVHTPWKQPMQNTTILPMQPKFFCKQSRNQAKPAVGPQQPHQLSIPHH